MVLEVRMSIHLKVLGFTSAVALLGAPVPVVAALGDVVYSSWDTTSPSGGEIKGFMHDTVSISDFGEVAILARVKPPKPDRMRECILVGSGSGAPDEVVCTGGAYDNIEQPQISADGSYVSWVGREGGTSGVYYTDLTVGPPYTTTDCVKKGDPIAGYTDPIANILSGRVVDDTTCQTVFLAVLPPPNATTTFGQQVLAQGTRGGPGFVKIADADHGSGAGGNYDSFVGNISVTTDGVAYEVREKNSGAKLPEIYQALASGAYTPALVADTAGGYERFKGAPVMSAGPNQGVCFLARMDSRATELHCCDGGDSTKCGLAVPDAFGCAAVAPRQPYTGKASQIKDFDVSNGVGGGYLVLQTSRAVCGCANPYGGACTLDNLLEKDDTVAVLNPPGGDADVRIFRPGVAVQPSAAGAGGSVASNGNARHKAKQKPRTAKAVFVTP
jgi:hypothetical protein